MDSVKILWTDDEIDLLKPHIMFLEEKGYEVSTASSGDEALDLVEDNYFDIVFLDENMPGLSGLDVLPRIKKLRKSLPVVMITKSEEEYIMDEAIGGEISDYLIKPVNPKQILLTLKKNLDEKKLVQERSSMDYQKVFREIGMRLSDRLSFEEWEEVYRDIVYWDLKLSESGADGMKEILDSQWDEANQQFSKFVTNNYLDWINQRGEGPLFSHQVLKQKVFSKIGQGPIFVFVIDCLRFDQWKSIQPQIATKFRVIEEGTYSSILPTATHYARNAFFAGLTPLEISRKYPDKWKSEDDEGSKNNEEAFFVEENLKRNGKQVSMAYEKILNLDRSKKLVEKIPQYAQNDINFIVYNFVDNLSHARTDTSIIRELAENENAYRKLTKTWFESAPLWQALERIADQHPEAKVFITTDHGTVKVDDPIKIAGSKELNDNLRYKIGREIQYPGNKVLVSKNPEDAQIPKQNLSDHFIVAKDRGYFAYKNNFNHYAKYYRNTFQHGGISLEEMLVPFIELKAK